MSVNSDAAKIFAGVKFTPPISTCLDTLGLNEPTPIQTAAIAPLTSGLSAILHAETGSGKITYIQTNMLLTQTKKHYIRRRRYIRKHASTT